MSTEGESNNSQDTGSTAGDTPPTTAPPQELNWSRFMEVVHTRKIDVALWATRIVTIFFSAFYMVPLMG